MDINKHFHEIRAESFHCEHTFGFHAKNDEQKQRLALQNKTNETNSVSDKNKASSSSLSESNGDGPDDFLFGMLLLHSPKKAQKSIEKRKLEAQKI